MKVRKKPVIVEAIQWNGFNKVPVIKEVHEYDPYKEGNPNYMCQNCGNTNDKHGWIATLEGGHIVCPGDWIITGVKGEKYPCKPDIFKLTYEIVD